MTSAGIVPQILAALRRRKGLALTVAVTSVALVLLEGASLVLIVPFLESLGSASARPAWLLDRFGYSLPTGTGGLKIVAVSIAGLVLVRAVVSFFSGTFSARLRLQVLLDLRESLARAYYQARFSDLAALGPGQMVNLFSTQTERVVDGIWVVVSAVTAALLAIVYGVAMLALSWRLSIVAAALGIAAAGASAFAARRIRIHAAEMIHAEEESSRLVADDVAGMSTIKAYDIGQSRLALHREANQAVYQRAMTVHRWRSAVRPTTDTLFALAVLAALVVPGGGWGERLLANLPLVIAFAFVLFRLQGQVGVLGEAVSTLAEQSGIGVNVLALLESSSAAEPDGTATLGGSVAQVQANQVVFGYGNTSVLRGLDLDANSGEIVAVVGTSGAGKSTLVQLLLRLRLPESGGISIDRAPLASVRRAALAETIGVVFEDCFLFDESIEWNITLGREFSPTQVQAAAGVAELDDVVRSLPGQYRFRVGPRGRNLSAGQRQRVVLARAIIARPEILILDEATNALDAPTEQSLVRRLREARPAGVTLVIAHRLSTVLAADRIVVLAGGRIVGTGRHAELLEGNESYRQLVESQLVDSPAQQRV